MSVVLPTHNRPVELLSAVHSVMSQDYPGTIELIVVFDAAEHVPMPAQTPGRVLRTIDNTRRRGLAGARNCGIGHASYDLVAFLDDDDEWMPGKLRAQVNLWRALPEKPVLVSCGIVMVTDNGEVPRPMKKTPTQFSDLLDDRIMELHSSTFLLDPTRFPTRATVIDEELPGSYAEDYDLLLRAARMAPIHSVREPQVRITWAGGSLFADKWITIAAALERLLDKNPEFSTVPRGYARIAGQIAFAHAAAGQRSRARSWAGRAMRRNPLEPRATLALLVSSKLIRPDTVRRILQRHGKGI